MIGRNTPPMSDRDAKVWMFWKTWHSLWNPNSTNIQQSYDRQRFYLAVAAVAFINFIAFALIPLCYVLYDQWERISSAHNDGIHEFC